MGRIDWGTLGRLTGLSFPFGGASWEPRPDERKIVEEAITYVENQGIFHAPFEWEHPADTYAAASNARETITHLMQRLLRSMKAFERLESIRLALRDFQRHLRTLNLQSVPSKSEMTNQQVTDYDAALTKLRTICGAQIAQLAATYHLSVSDELEPWLRMPQAK